MGGTQNSDARVMKGKAWMHGSAASRAMWLHSHHWRVRHVALATRAANHTTTTTTPHHPGAVEGNASYLIYRKCSKGGKGEACWATRQGLPSALRGCAPHEHRVMWSLHWLLHGAKSKVTCRLTAHAGDPHRNTARRRLQRQARHAITASRQQSAKALEWPNAQTQLKSRCRRGCGPCMHDCCPAQADARQGGSRGLPCLAQGWHSQPARGNRYITATSRTQALWAPPSHGLPNGCTLCGHADDGMMPAPNR